MPLTPIVLPYIMPLIVILEDNEILANIDKIKDISTIIVHNRLDMCCPLKGAWELYRSLNNAQIEIVADIGHGGKKLKKAFRKHF